MRGGQLVFSSGQVFKKWSEPVYPKRRRCPDSDGHPDGDPYDGGGAGCGLGADYWGGY